jgi:hypothetical protein
LSITSFLVCVYSISLLCLAVWFNAQGTTAQYGGASGEKFTRQLTTLIVRHFHKGILPVSDHLSILCYTPLSPVPASRFQRSVTIVPPSGSASMSRVLSLPLHSTSRL